MDNLKPSIKTRVLEKAPTPFLIARQYQIISSAN
jgi:hypothetical protein